MPEVDMGLPQLLSPSCLRQGSLTQPGVYWLLWLTSELLEFSCLCLPVLGLYVGWSTLYTSSKSRPLLCNNYLIHRAFSPACILRFPPPQSLLFFCVSSLLSIQADKVICLLVCLFYIKPFAWEEKQKWAAHLPGLGSTDDGILARKHTNNMLARNPRETILLQSETVPRARRRGRKNRAPRLRMERKHSLTLSTPRLWVPWTKRLPSWRVWWQQHETVEFRRGFKYHVYFCTQAPWTICSISSSQLKKVSHKQATEFSDLIGRTRIQTKQTASVSLNCCAMLCYISR